MRSSKKRLNWQRAIDIQKRVKKLVKTLDLDWIDYSKIYCFRSNNSKARAYARIWGLSTIWQKALNTKASYCIEVLSEKFDHLAKKKQDEILLHELAHIPKTFSGSLLPHTKRGKGNFHDKVRELVKLYNRNI